MIMKLEDRHTMKFVHPESKPSYKWLVKRVARLQHGRDHLQRQIPALKTYIGELEAEVERLRKALEHIAQMAIDYEKATIKPESLRHCIIAGAAWDALHEGDKT